MSNTLKTLKISGGVLGLYCLTLATAPAASACEPCGVHVAPTIAPISNTGGIGGNTFYNGSNYSGFGGGSGGGGGGRPNFNNVGTGFGFSGGRPNFTNVATGGSFGGAFGGSGGSTTFNNMSTGSGFGGGGGGYGWGGGGGGIGGGGGAGGGGGIGGGGGAGGGIGGGGGAGGGIGGGGGGGGIGGGGGGNGGGNGGGGNVGGNPGGGTPSVLVIGKSGVDASTSPLSFGAGTPSAFSGSTVSLALEFQQRLAAAQGAYESASQRLAQAGTAQPVASSGPQRYSRVPGDLADCGCLNPDLASDTSGSELAAAKVAEAEAAAELAKAKAETRQFLESVQTNNSIAGNASNFSPIW